LDTGTPKNILLLCNFYPGCAQTIINHIQAFKLYSRNNYFILSNLGDLPDWLDLSRFDALVFHYTLIASHDNYISPTGRKRIRKFEGFKAAFVQDDYRWINDTVEALAYMGIHALFPLTSKDIIDTVYSPKMLPNLRKETVFAGYVPQNLVEMDVKPYKERRLDIGYRARKLPAWIGSHTLQKWQIAERFKLDAVQFGLKVDISCREEDRIYGEDWINFISNCRATLGTESGASICDFTGEIMRNVEAHLLKYPDEKFETLRSIFFENEDNKIVMNIISPRCFESAALRTLMILYEGEYSGVLIPWRHYVPLKRDHSNIAEVVQILKSVDESQKIINQAFEEVAKNKKYSYEAMIQLVDRVMDEEWSNSLRKGEQPYSQKEFEWHVINDAGCTQFLNFKQSRKSNIFSFRFIGLDSWSTGKKMSDVIELSMRRRAILVQSISIRWREGEGSPPRQFQLQGFLRKKIQYTQEISNLSHETFQSILFSKKMPATDLLVISSITNTDSSWPKLISISILGDEISIKRNFLIFFDKYVVGLLKHVWHILPKRIRTIFFPIATQIKNQLQKLSERLSK
jgi:hypothetical protein